MDDAISLLEEAASDLESYIAHDYPAADREKWPDIQRRYDRDMWLVRKIRKFVQEQGTAL